MAEYDNVEMSGDDSLFLPPGEMDVQQALARNVRRNPALVMPSSGVQPPKPPQRMPAARLQQAAGPQVPQGPTSGDLLRQLTERMYQRPDTDAYVKQAQERGDTSDRDLMLSLTLGARGGEAFQPASAQFLKRALDKGGDYEIPGGWGHVSRSGEVVWNPAKLNEMENARLTKLYEIARDDETKRELAQQRADLLKAGQGARSDAAAAKAEEKGELDRSRRVDTVRREFNARRDKIVQGSAFADQVVQQLADPNLARNAPGQVALVMQFGKMLDPDSVVREAEQRMIAQARGWFDSLMVTPERIMSGQFLTPQQLAQMRQIALQYQQGYGQRVSDLEGFYSDLAERNKLPTEDIIPGGRKPQGGGGRGIDAGARLQSGGGGGGRRVVDSNF